MSDASCLLAVYILFGIGFGVGMANNLQQDGKDVQVIPLVIVMALWPLFLGLLVGDHEE